MVAATAANSAANDGSNDFAGQMLSSVATGGTPPGGQSGKPGRTVRRGGAPHFRTRTARCFHAACYFHTAGRDSGALGAKSDAPSPRRGRSLD